MTETLQPPWRVGLCLAQGGAWRRRQPAGRRGGGRWPNCISRSVVILTVPETVDHRAQRQIRREYHHLSARGLVPLSRALHQITPSSGDAALLRYGSRRAGGAAPLLWLLSAEEPSPQGQGQDLHRVSARDFAPLRRWVVVATRPIAQPPPWPSPVQVHSQPPPAHPAAQRRPGQWCLED